MNDDQRHFRVLTFYNADGTFKQWGWCDLGGGSAEIRWGRLDTLSQGFVTTIRRAMESERKKLRKGYRNLSIVHMKAKFAPADAVATKPSEHTHNTSSNRKAKDRAHVVVDIASELSLMNIDGTGISF